MNANLESKKQLVEEIKEKLQAAKSVVFVDYAGLNVAEADKLRKEFRNNQAEYKVYKNRLLLRALQELGISGVDAHLEGTTSVAFGYEDQVTAAKIIANTIKETKKMSIKFGLLDGAVVDGEYVKKLSQLPTKEVLVAQLLSVLNGPMSALARALDAIKQKQEA
jgi:large subunit ribosomal protein L10